MADIYPLVNGTLAGNDVTYLILYANSVTGGWFGFFMVIAFFILVLISSLMMQLRLTGRIRPETSVAAACFVTLGFEVILSQRNGLIDPGWIIFSVALTVISVIWLAFSSE